MAQVKKPDVDRRIRRAALERFADDGYEHASMASIAHTAGMAAANIYRYYPQGKRQLFDSVITDGIAQAHHELIVARVRALLLPLRSPFADDPQAELPTDQEAAAQRLLDFWVAHRLEVVVLLGRAAGTRFANYGDRFVGLLAELGVERLRSAGVDPPDAVRDLFTIIFDNTRRALVGILAVHDQPDDIRHAIEGFWSYQLPGLDGLYRWATSARPPTG